MVTSSVRLQPSSFATVAAGCELYCTVAVLVLYMYLKVGTIRTVALMYRYFTGKTKMTWLTTIIFHPYLNISRRHKCTSV
jgi:hypothetical protein